MFDDPMLASPEIVGNGDVRGVSYGSDRGLYVEFRSEDVYQEFRSQEEGRPIYESVPFVRLYTPGDSTKVVDRPVKLEAWGDIPSDPQRFPQQWAAFQLGVKAEHSGTTLSSWPMITTGQVKALNAVNIYTLEQLAEVSDGALDGLGHGGRMLRDQAVARLAASRDDAFQTRLVADNTDLRAQVEAMQAQIAAMNDPEKRGPGRPRKEVTDGE